MSEIKLDKYFDVAFDSYMDAHGRAALAKVTAKFVMDFFERKLKILDKLSQHATKWDTIFSTSVLMEAVEYAIAEKVILIEINIGR